MINKTPSNSDQFPVPVVGQLIPRGWFPRLVAFMNSLVLHGDNQYLAVRHDMNGTTISPTKKLIDALNQRGAPPSAGGGGGGGAGGLCIPDYLHPTAITPNQLYQPIGYPVWIMGNFSASPPMYQSDISTYMAQINLGDGNGNTESLRLFDLATQNQPKEINTIQTFVSLLVPGDFLFTIETSPAPLPASYFSVNLKYYPLLSNP